MNTGSANTSARRGYSFLHLSDVHFGQEKGGQLFINQEIKKDLVNYLKDLASGREAANRPALDAVLVTGDIAFSGQESQYKEAAQWLAEITDAVGTEKAAVHVVPGNHDVDRNQISPSVHDMIDKIIEKGQPALDIYMADESDRERLYLRFAEYRVFAAGYGCVLDREGGAAGSKDFPLANGLNLRFIGMNSALVCRGRQEDEQPGKLFLGYKQQAVSSNDGVEQIILMHHPISWLADGMEVWKRFKNRARIFISGHEHKPNLEVEEVAGNGKVLKIDSGAIIPPGGEEGYGYTFNIIDLVLGDNDDELHVRVEGHIWDEDTTFFREDRERFEGTHEHCAVLPCPRFAKFKCKDKTAAEDAALESSGQTQAGSAQTSMTGEAGEGAMTRDGEDPFPELRLNYFHKLSALQRLQVLIDLEVLPADWKGTMTPGFELAALEALVGMGRLKDLEKAVEKYTGGK